ncbi:MAG TPA: hypothetical protein PLQ88_23625, partial [Blastocatellia bacterium]|nr:hypothetical protein [Blastocatellia bacterium]
MTKTTGRRIFPLVFLVVLMIAAGWQPKLNHSIKADDKLTPQAVIAKHLEAIGTQEARAAIKSRVFTGDGKFSQKSGRGGQLQGPALLATDGKKILLGMNFGHTSYPFEQFGYDGKKTTV